MNRSQFLRHIIPVALIPALPYHLLASGSVPSSSIQPPFLQPGDSIGITCPAGALNIKDLDVAKKLLESWQFKVVEGITVGKSWMVFGGTDEERATDLQQLINNPQVKAILCGRGGYGVTRILDQVDLSPLVKNPKWIIGYSDITALHCALQQYNIASIHADMVNGLGTGIDSSSFSLYELLTGTRPAYSIYPSGYNRIGTGEGQLVGGNLSILLATMGSKDEIKTEGRILFLEDVGEYKYAIDRMLVTLKRAGKLENLNGLVIGGFTRLKEDTPDDFTMNIGDIIMEKVSSYHYPVCFNFPAGHQVLNMGLKLGAVHKLQVEEKSVSLACLE